MTEILDSLQNLKQSLENTLDHDEKIKKLVNSYSLDEKYAFGYGFKDVMLAEIKLREVEKKIIDFELLEIIENVNAIEKDVIKFVNNNGPINLGKDFDIANAEQKKLLIEEYNTATQELKTAKLAFLTIAVSTSK